MSFDGLSNQNRDNSPKGQTDAGRESRIIHELLGIRAIDGTSLWQIKKEKLPTATQSQRDEVTRKIIAGEITRRNIDHIVRKVKTPVAHALEQSAVTELCALLEDKLKSLGPLAMDYYKQVLLIFRSILGVSHTGVLLLRIANQYPLPRDFLNISYQALASDVDTETKIELVEQVVITIAEAIYGNRLGYHYAIQHLTRDAFAKVITGKNLRLVTTEKKTPDAESVNYIIRFVCNPQARAWTAQLLGNPQITPIRDISSEIAQAISDIEHQRTCLYEELEQELGEVTRQTKEIQASLMSHALEVLRAYKPRSKKK